MLAPSPPVPSVAELRARIASTAVSIRPGLPFGIADLERHLAGGGMATDGVHEVAGASPGLSDDAAATLFVAGLAARFASKRDDGGVLWALTRFDPYAPGLEQAGLPANMLLFAQGKDDAEVLALAEDGLREGALAVVVAEVRRANMVATRRLQLAASEGGVPVVTVPGVGPITALTYTASIEDPRRFARSDDVGAYAGLVPRRNQSGERDTSGHISKAGDPMLRRALYEAANVILSQVKKPFALQQWGKKIAEAKGAKRARTAVARKLAALLHSLWLNETEFRWAYTDSEMI